MAFRRHPSFEDWVEYCFTLGYGDFHAGPKLSDYEQVEARLRRFVELPPALLAKYVIRLFRDPAFIAERYRDDRIGDATWFLFGIPSEYFRALRTDAVSHQRQSTCISTVTALYTELYDRVCCERGADPGGDYTNDRGVDGAVYMIWDMDSIEGAILSAEETPHLVEPCFAVLETALMKCRTSSCQKSALHGLGHVRMHHQNRNSALAGRAREIIERFLTTRRPVAWLRKHAEAAMVGGIL